MRLLNTTTLQVEEPQREPQYAIVSHVWNDEEVTFRDISEPQAVKLAGYAKLERSCKQALTDGYQYLWIDTCCIDKSSSAELSEAINSMYNWYSKAAVCYAYLDDVHSDEDPLSKDSEFCRSRWFKRGWTLQEAIAPRKLIFFAKNWVKIGTKYSLVSAVASITGVDERVLLATLPLADVSVAKKMSWASQRRTTRIEDRAYSLMGIFGVHMPLIYGEGQHAFIRLQHEIMRTSNDQSIFAWSSTTAENGAESFLLAPSPDHFLRSATIDRVSPIDFARLFTPASMDGDYKSHFVTTNSGVQIYIPIKRTPSLLGYTAVLACSSDGCLVGLYLHPCGGGLFQRTLVHHIPKIPGPYDEFQVRDIIISVGMYDQRAHPLPSLPSPESLHGSSAIVRVKTQLYRTGFVPLGQGPYDEFKWTPTTPNDKCIVAYQHRTTGEIFVVTIGGWSDHPCVHIDTFTGPEETKHRFSSYDHGLSSRCCDNRPLKVSKPLSTEGKTVTVSSHQRNTWEFTVTISVDGPQREVGYNGVSIGETLPMAERPLSQLGVRFPETQEFHVNVYRN